MGDCETLLVIPPVKLFRCSLILHFGTSHGSFAAIAKHREQGSSLYYET